MSFHKSYQNLDDEDLYSFETNTSSRFNQTVERTGWTSYVQPMKTAVNLKSSYQVHQDGNESFRPMTSTRAAGFTSRGRSAANKSKIVNPFEAMKGNAVKSEKPNQSSAHEQIKSLETKMLSLVNQSCVYTKEQKPQLALETAKEAFHLEKQAIKISDKYIAQINGNDTPLPSLNLDAQLCVELNLALCYQGCGMLTEALSMYTALTKNKVLIQGGKLRVNIGNVYMEMKDYSNALKMFRMALDQIPPTNKMMRLKLLKNIGLACIKLGQFQDAINAYEAVLESNPDHHTVFNLMLCYHAAGDDQKMKMSFQKMTKIDPPVLDTMVEQDQQRKFKNLREKIHQETGVQTEKLSLLNVQSDTVVVEDQLHMLSREKKKISDRYLILASKLIAPIVESELSDPNKTGFDWIVQVIKESPNADLVPEVEIAKAIGYLKTKSFHKAIETFKSFENKDVSMVGTASTNLSFLYLLEQDIINAEKYVDVAIDMDRYNAKALTNKGNCYYYKQDFEKAKSFYLDAIAVDALCIEAMFNLGLLHKRNKEYEEALQCFEKLFSIVQDSPDVIYHVATIHEAEGRDDKALEWFNILISVVPTDPTILARLGDLYVKAGDSGQAFHYYSESFRYYPANLHVMTWLGAYYIDCEMFEQAITYFKHAALMDKKQVKWPLTVASCYRKMGLHMNAIQVLTQVHEKYPQHIECLKMLINVGQDLDLNQVPEYRAKLARLEKNQGLSTPSAFNQSQQSESATTNSASKHQRVKSALVRSTPNLLDAPSVQRNSSEPRKKNQVLDMDWQEDIGELLP